MKKSLAIILAILMLLPCCLAPASAGLLDDEGIEFGVAEGYVRTKEVYKDSYGGSTTTANAYDADGLLTKTVKVEKYPSGGTSKTTTAYAYNSDWKVAKKVEVEVSDDYSSKLTTVYSYGKVYKETTSYKMSGGYYYKSTTAYYFNQYGNPTKIVETFKNENGSSTDTQTFSYDRDLNLTKTVRVYKDNGYVTKETTTYGYDRNGYLNKVSSYQTLNGKWDVSTVTTYTNDSDARVLKEVQTYSDAEGNNYKTTTNYQYKSNRLSKKTEVFDADDYMRTTVTSYTYKNGNLTKEVESSRTEGYDHSYSTKTTIAYSYDKAGNLLKKVSVQKDSEGDVFKEVWTYKCKKMWDF